MKTKQDVLNAMDKFTKPEIVFVEVESGKYYAAKGYGLLVQSGIKGPTYTDKDIDMALGLGVWIETQMKEVA